MIQSLNEQQRQSSLWVSLIAKIQYIVGISGRGTLRTEETAFFATYIRDNWGKRLPVNEIESAFFLAAQKKLDINTDDAKAYNTISVAYIETILQAYMTYRHKLIVPTSSPAIPQQCELTQDEKDGMIWGGILSAFEAYKATGEKVDFGSVKYDFLKERGMIPFTKERRSEMFQQAKKKVTADFEAKMIKATNCRDISKLKDEVLNNGKEFSLRCIEEAKTIALNTLFSELVESGSELTDLVQE